MNPSYSRIQPALGLGLLASLVLVFETGARVFVATNSTWRYFKGTREASDPTNAWREVVYDDSAWLGGISPFHYGTNALGGDDDLTGGTILSDMRSNYTCVYLRQQFVVPDTNHMVDLTLKVWYDDGLAMWFNGQAPGNPLSVSGGVAHTNTASSSREGSSARSFPIRLSLLRPGTNVLCLQAFNRSLTDDDCRIDVELAEQPGTIKFAVSTTSVPENLGEVVVPVVRTGGLDAGTTVDYTTTDGSALAGADYEAVSGRLTFAEGQTEQWIPLAILNDWMPEPTESFQVTLSNPGGGAVLGSVANVMVRIADNDKGLQFELAAYSVSEDVGEARIRVLRGDDGDFPVSVNYATANLTANAGQDYRATAGTFTFESGEAVKYLVVPLVNDAVLESAEEFRVALSHASEGGLLGTPNLTTVTITDTDNVVQFGSASYPTPENAALVQVSLTRGESRSVDTVDLTTAPGSAAAGLDYEGMTNTIRFAAGERLRLVNIPILNDGLKEAPENFSLTLSNATGGAVLGSRRTATVTIVDNDPGIGFEQNTYTVWENWGVANIHVLRGNDQILGPFAVNYSTADGSARAGVDYEAVSGTLEFKANEAVRSLTIPLLDAPASGSARHFTVLLRNPTGGIPLGTATTLISILNVSPGGSHPVVPPLDARLKIRWEQQMNIVTWGGIGSLLRADQVTGPWEECAGARSPYASHPVWPAGFYQMRSTRPTKVYVPARYDGQTPLPLVVVLHGYSGDAAWMENYFRFQPVAESRGLFLCYPQGTLDAQGWRFWNATDACCDFYGAGEDDSAYLRSVIEDIARRFAVDRKRIYVTGLSNGGYMSHRMACDHADLIAGIASLAGSTFLDPGSHRPGQPVNVLQIHGTSDGTVPYEGGALVGLPVLALFPGAVKTVEAWAQLNGCQGPVVDPAPSMDLTTDVAGLDTTVLRYTNAPPGGSVNLWTISGGSHVPTLSVEFPEKLADWFLAHPKP